MQERDALMVLNAVSGLGSVTITQLIDCFGSAEEVLQVDQKHFVDIGVPKVLAENITRFNVTEFLMEEWRLMARQEVKIISFVDEDYPESLRNIPGAPIVLYVMGTLPDNIETSLSIVGSRKCSFYGRKIANQFGYQLANLGINVISGMARGIDTEAHRGCLKARGKTVAVLGCGLNEVYPPENKELRDQIVEHGAVISEFPMTMLPLAHNFPRRNRIVSGISLGTIVVEAAARSGALITARTALEQGRDVFALPGNIDTPMAQGALSLIKQGAKLVTSIDDVLEELHLELRHALKEIEKDSETLKKSPKIAQMSEEEQKIYYHLKNKSQHVDQIAQLCDTSSSLLVATLMQMEMKGAIQQEPGMMFRKRK